ncbi:MAG: DUF1684 domain-containing protein [bacterium]
MALFISLLFATILCSCQTQQNSEGSVLDDAEKIARIEQQRQAKDKVFKQEVESPLPDGDKPLFTGLDYYPVDLRYALRLPLMKYGQKEIFKIVTSTGMLRDAEKYGYFELELHGQLCQLQVYRLLDIQSQYPGYLFVPFMDATTSKETYAGGRYLDLQENELGIYELDFNLAYNPSCAYGKEGYNCPIPPAENWLPVAIRAGEKNYDSGDH